jgi:tetratricopeptide (TPR) repeat protein
MKVRHFRHILFFFIVLFASCGTVRRGVVPNEEVTLSVSDQRKYEYYFLEAIRLEQQNRYDEAFEMLQHCLSICPTAPSAQSKLANYYFAMNQKDKAHKALLCAVEDEPDNYWYRQTLALYYQGNREYDKAIEVIEEMQTRFPKRNGELLPALVGLYNHTAQYDKVIDALGRLEQITGKSEAISMEKTRNYLAMGNTEGAFNEMEALSAEYPDNSYYRVILAEVYMDHGRANEAEPILRDVLSEEPDNGAAKVTLTEYYKLQGDTANYLNMADSVMMATEMNEEFKVRMMLQLIKEGQDSLWLMDLFERAIALPQQSAQLGHLCAQYMVTLEQPEERIRPVLLRILEIEPDHIPARSQLLSYAASRNDVEEMVRLCSEGIDYTPEVLEYYYYKGIGLAYYLHRPAEALETFRGALRQVTAESDAEIVSDICTTMGDLLQEQGSVEEACDCYDKALQYKPANHLVLNNYAYCLAEEGIELEKAEQMSRLTIEAEPDNATYLDTYAWILYKLQRYDEALTHIEHAIEVDTAPSDVLYEHAGDIHQRLGHKAQALDYWHKALLWQREHGTVDKELEKKIKQLK